MRQLIAYNYRSKGLSVAINVSNQNDKSETLLHNNRAICYDRNEINRDEN